MVARGHSDKFLADIRARLTLRSRRHPYYLLLMTGRSFGYMRDTTKVGRWIARVRLSGDRYREKILGRTDDYEVADCSHILSFDQAYRLAIDWFSSPEHAAGRVKARIFGINSQLNVCPISNDYTVAHAVAEFVEWRRGFQAFQSLVAAVSLANTYILPTIGTVLCSELSADQVRSVALTVEATARKRGSFQSRQLIDPNTLSPEARRKRLITANNTLSIFRSALKKAHREDKIQSDKAWKFAHGFPRVDLARPTCLSWQEAKRLVDHARPDLHQLILAAFYTGCRITELFRITARDVLPNRMALYIHPLKNYRARTIALPEEGYGFFRFLARGRGDHGYENKKWKTPRSFQVVGPG